MPRVEFQLHIQSSEVEKYYKGLAKSIVVRATNGLRIQFPAGLILPYVTHSGVQGQFVLDYDDTGKAKSLSRL